jgi:integrase/recombinase XerD
MSTLAPALEAFFTERLMTQRRASAHTIAAYRDCFRLLLGYVHDRTGKTPSRLQIVDLDTTMITAFLEHLERDRNNSVRTRNARLAGLRSFFRFAALRYPEHAGQIQRVLAIPDKRTDRGLVCYLTAIEVDALLASPNRTTPAGRRDHTLIALTVQTGLRVSELTGLRLADIHLDTGAHVRVQGKGRKERSTPLTAQTVTLLQNWMIERGGQLTDPLFPGRGQRPLSTDAVQRLLTKHATAASDSCPSLRAKHVTPHVLRHTAAMSLLAGGVEATVISLWLGHERLESTDIYIHADLSIKERALARTTPPNTPPGRYHANDTLLAFLERL